jgi:hypothetical protein
MNDDSAERGSNRATSEMKARSDQLSLGRFTWRWSTSN